ncbi:MAG: ABC transporter substrate-binding protein [Deltaproteobacteria bacterium]|nr:ABC transporter substrate-binding protein [Deltaproteobacteria bacterium]MBW2016441.1 ABC transporter substrate-binding protein [Deltaproteobacteria bacterium]
MLRSFGKWVTVFIFLVVSPLLMVTDTCAGQVLRFGVLPVVDTLPLWVGREEGFFKSKGLDLEIVPFQSALERDAALQAGKLDGYFGDILNTLLLARSRLTLEIVTTAFKANPVHRMFALVTAPESGIQDLDGLKGKPVAISRATIIEYLLDRLLQAYGKGPGYVEKQEIKKIPIRLQMLLANQIPAALLPEPLVTLAETKGGRVLLDDRILETTLTILALKRGLAGKDPSLVPRFLEAYGKAVDAINANPGGYMATLLNRTRFPKSLKDRYSIPGFPPVTLPDPKDIEDAQDWLIRNGLMDTPMAYEEVVYSGRAR